MTLKGLGVLRASGLEGLDVGMYIVVEGFRVSGVCVRHIWIDFAIGRTFRVGGYNLPQRACVTHTRRAIMEFLAELPHPVGHGVKCDPRRS